MRRHVPTISLLGTLVFLPACGTTAAPPPAADARPVAGPDSDPSIELVRLQHIAASTAAEIVTDLIRSASGTAPESPRVVADERRNALVVHGDAVERAHIRDLLKALDKPDLP